MSSSPNPAQPQAAPLMPGAVIGSYEILSLIGGGGMGDVYRARHSRIGRQVAVKVLRDDLPRREEASHRFLEEARAVNDIGHPNIVEIHDFVELEDREPKAVFLVMELLEGCDLSSYVRDRGPLDPAEAVAVAVPVAKALAAVHSRGLLHRDLKPGNIFLSPQAEGPPKITVLDFGAIKTMDPDIVRQELTQPGMAVGTPSYMAPEQVMDGTLDERTDVYALGVVLYKMLTGEVPFENASLSKLMVLIARTAPERPSLRRDRAPAIPPALEELVMRCLAKFPEDRYPDMPSLSQALARCLDGTAAPGSHEVVTRQEPALGVEPLEPLTGALHVPRPRWVLPVVAAVVLLALAGVLVWLTSDEGGSPSAGLDAAAVAADAGATDIDHRGDGTRAAPADADAGAPPDTVGSTRPAAKKRGRPRRRPRRRPASKRRDPAGKQPANLKIVDPFKK